MEVKELLAEIDRLQVVDVREQDEWEAGHVRGALHLPLDEVASERHSVDWDKPVVTVCRTGARSSAAADLLREVGVDAYSLNGGLRAWAAAGQPLVDSTGAQGRVLEETGRDSGSPEFKDLQGNLIEVAYGLQERFGNREPTDAEARIFMRVWLLAKGTPEEEIEKILDDDSV
ncbi:MAG: rhodanese-like domain-containing protein [Actinobacteria bacterium]|nr:rhodanese-like domain-containing protein [Actinomycetota bacterium]